MREGVLDTHLSKNEIDTSALNFATTFLDTERMKQTYLDTNWYFRDSERGRGTSARNSLTIFLGTADVQLLCSRTIA